MEGDDSVETARGDMTSGGVSGGVGIDASSVEQERGGVAFTPGMSTSLRVELSSLVVCCTIASWLLGLVGSGVVMGSGGSAISIWSYPSSSRNAVSGSSSVVSTACIYGRQTWRGHGMDEGPTRIRLVVKVAMP